MKKYLYLIFIILFLFFIGSGLVVSPFFGDINVIDEGQFGGWIAHMLHGDKLYLDTYAAYGPLYIYPYYFASLVFGQSIFVMRVVYTVLNVFVAILIVDLILKKFEVRRIVRWVSLGIILVVPGFGMRQASALLTLFLLNLAFEKKSKKLWLCTGIALSSTLLISSDMGIFAGVITILAIIFYAVLIKNIKSFLVNLQFFILGFLLVIIPFSFFSYLDGWLASYVGTVLDDYVSYSGIGLPNGQAFPNVLTLFPGFGNFWLMLKFVFSREVFLYWHYLFYICLAAYVVVDLVKLGFKKANKLFIFISFFGFFLSLILIGRYGHIPFVFSTTVILGAYKVNQLLKSKSRKAALLLVIVLVLFSARFISFYRPHFPRVLELPKAIFSEKAKSERVGLVSISKKQDEQFLLIQKFINSNTKKDERIFFLGNEPIMYMIADRTSPTRFNLPEVVNSKEKRYEIISSLEIDKTRFIIENLEAWDVDGVSNRKRLPEVMDYIEKNYSKKLMGNFLIYRRK